MAKTSESAIARATQRIFTPGMEVHFKGGMGIVSPKPTSRPPKDSKGKVPVQVRGSVKWYPPEELTPADAKSDEPTPPPPEQPQPAVEVSPEQRYLLLSALTGEYQADLKICSDTDYHSAHLINRHLKVMEEEKLVESMRDAGGYEWVITEAGINSRTELAKTVVIQQDPWRTFEEFAVTLYDGCEVRVVFKPDNKNGSSHHFAFHGQITETGYRSYFFGKNDCEAFDTPQEYAEFCANSIREEYLKKHPPVIEVGDWVVSELLIDAAKKRITEKSKHHLYGQVKKVKGKKVLVSWHNGDEQEEPLANLHKFEPLFVRAIEELEKANLPTEAELAHLNPVERNLQIDLARLDEKTRDRIQSRTEKIHTLKRGVVSDLIAIGKELLEQKQDLRQHGIWLNWLELNGWEGAEGERDAQYLMSVGETFGHLDPNTSSLFDYSSLKLLASRSVEKDPALFKVRAQFITQAQQGVPVRHRDVKAALDKVRKPVAALPVKRPDNPNQGYSPSELKGLPATARSSESVDSELAQKAEAVGLSNGKQVLPTVVRNSPPAEVDDRPFANPTLVTNGNGYHTTVEVTPQPEDSGEIPLTAFVENITEQEAIEIVQAIGKKFGGRIFEAALQALKTRA
jgi:hypothetical protein